MDRYEQEIVEKYRKDLNDGKMMDKLMDLDHIFRHVERTGADMLERILSGQCRRTGVFESANDANDFIDEALYNKMPEIVDWLENDTITKRKAIVVGFEGETVGTSISQYRNDIKEYVDDTITVVLSRDKLDYYGFHITTAYPSESENSKQTHRDLTDDLRQTMTYQRKSPLEQVYMEYQISDATIPVNQFYNHTDNTTYLQLAMGPKNKYHINIAADKNRCGIVEYNPHSNPAKKIYAFQSQQVAHLKEQYPDAMQVAMQLHTSIQRKLNNRNQYVFELEEQLQSAEKTDSPEFE